jgi:hypothetical protein
VLARRRARLRVQWVEAHALSCLVCAFAEHADLAIDSSGSQRKSTENRSRAGERTLH